MTGEPSLSLIASAVGDRFGVAAQKVPVTVIDTSLGRIHAHAVGLVDGPVETDRNDGERVFTERVLCNRYRACEISRDERAYMTAAGVDEADDEGLAAQRRHLERLPVRILQNLPFEYPADGGLAELQCGVAVMLRLRKRRSAHDDAQADGGQDDENAAVAQHGSGHDEAIEYRCRQ